MTLKSTFAWVALLAALYATPAMAQFGTGQPGAESPRTKRLAAELIVRDGALSPGRDGMVGVLLTMQPGWKIQAGLGSGDEVKPYIPTEISLTVPDGWTFGAPLWPAAKPFTLGDDEWSETLMVYEETALVVIPVRPPDDAAEGEHEISASIRYQACDHERCELPTSLTARATIGVAPSLDDGAAALDEHVAALFAAVLERHGGEAPGVDQPAPTAAAPEFGRPSFFGVAVPSFQGPLGLILLALFAAIGGFILNLTPCVLPVIPIKIMTIIQHANSPGKNLVLGVWMFLGVVAFWVALGLPVALVAEVTDPSRIFGIWWLTLGIGVLIALMGLGIMGLFAIQLPTAVYAINPKADTAWGSFAFGIMTGVLGLPCFGFVAGALLAGAATMPTAHVMTIFTALGVGMAVPYLVLSLNPSLVERVPRTGPASELVKQVMGLLLLAAAAYFIGSGLIALVSDMPYMARQLHWWTIALFAALASVWMIVRTFQITPSAFARFAVAIIALVIGGVAVVYASDSTIKARHDWDRYQAALADQDSAGYVRGVWNRWTPTSFEAARNDDHIVVLDFTAEWCLNCKALKATVLDREPVRSLLGKEDVVKFTVDLTSGSDPGWAFMRNELGQSGIPLLAIYTPGVEQPWQANAYTSQQVVAALEEARAQRIARR